jgi:hypothetical protein
MKSSSYFNRHGALLRNSLRRGQLSSRRSPTTNAYIAAVNSNNLVGGSRTGRSVASHHKTALIARQTMHSHRGSPRRLPVVAGTCNARRIGGRRDEIHGTAIPGRWLRQRSGRSSHGSVSRLRPAMLTTIFAANQGLRRGLTDLLVLHVFMNVGTGRKLVPKRHVHLPIGVLGALVFACVSAHIINLWHGISYNGQQMLRRDWDKTTRR